jgi:hypothetical protein
MFKRLFAPFLLTILSAAAQTLTTHTYGGSGSDAITGIALDAGGNMYVTGTTTSFDLPLLHASQPQNSGTSLVYSTDAGLTWLAASNPIVPDPNLNAQPLAIDPTNAQVIYTLANGAVLKSTDGGLHFSTVGSLPGAGIILADPTNPQTLYAEADSSLDTVYTSTDAGATWNLAASGLPNEIIQTLLIDPFSGNLWLTFDDSAWILKRGAAAWSQIPIPLPTGDFLSGGFSFDHATQGVVYGPSFINSGTLYPLKSTDGGQTWTLLKTPFLALNGLVTDAVRAGYVYYLDLSPRPVLSQHRWRLYVAVLRIPGQPSRSGRKRSGQSEYSHRRPVSQHRRRADLEYHRRLSRPVYSLRPQRQWHSLRHCPGQFRCLHG